MADATATAKDSVTTRGKRGAFFAIGRDSFIRATDLGLMPALALLVLASGSQKDNVTTRWSAESVRTRLGTNWTMANRAITDLADAGLAVVTNAEQIAKTPRTPPRYELVKEGQAVWLPRTLVDGAGSEIPPVQLIRQTHDVLLLRLLVDFYAHQNLPEHQGLSPDLVYLIYEELGYVTQYGGWTIWQVDYESGRVRVGAEGADLIRPHLIEPKSLTKPERDHWKRLRPDWALTTHTAFWHRLWHLLGWNLIEIVPYLFDGPLPDGMPLFPLHRGSSIELEQDLAYAAELKAEACLIDWKRARLDSDGNGGPLVPVPSHITQVTIIGIFRLHYRPRTSMTAGWHANWQANLKEWITRFGGELPDETAQAPDH